MCKLSGIGRLSAPSAYRADIFEKYLPCRFRRHQSNTLHQKTLPITDRLSKGAV
ncbi:TPA: hypothetical protein WLC86_002105, partial [Neisseria gonorrhoeae]